MSFYGSVFYEFRNIFSKWLLANSKSENINEDFNSDSIDSIEADERWDQCYFQGGNRWVEVTSLPDDDKKGIAISHGAPGSREHMGYGLETMEISESEWQERQDDSHYQQLTPDSVIYSPGLQFDKAGHFVDFDTDESMFYRLPNTTSSLDNQFDQATTAPTLKPVAAAGDTTVALEAGQTIEIPVFDISQKGLITDINSVTYKLPDYNGDVSFGDLSNRITAVNSRVDDCVTIDGLSEITGDLDDSQAQLDVPEVSIAGQLVGLQDNLTHQIEDVDAKFGDLVASGSTINSEAITISGQLLDINAKFGDLSESQEDLNSDTADTVSAQLIELHAQTSDAFDAVDEKLGNLTASSVIITEEHIPDADVATQLQELHRLTDVNWVNNNKVVASMETLSAEIEALKAEIAELKNPTA